MRADMERAERAYDLNLVAELKHGKLPTLEAELEALEKVEKKRIPFLRKKSRLRKLLISLLAGLAYR